MVTTRSQTVKRGVEPSTSVPVYMYPNKQYARAKKTTIPKALKVTKRTKVGSAKTRTTMFRDNQKPIWTKSTMSNSPTPAQCREFSADPAKTRPPPTRRPSNHPGSVSIPTPSIEYYPLQPEFDPLRSNLTLDDPVSIHQLASSLRSRVYSLAEEICRMHEAMPDLLLMALSPLLDRAGAMGDDFASDTKAQFCGQNVHPNQNFARNQSFEQNQNFDQPRASPAQPPVPQIVPAPEAPRRVPSLPGPGQARRRSWGQDIYSTAPGHPSTTPEYQSELPEHHSYVPPYSPSIPAYNPNAPSYAPAGPSGPVYSPTSPKYSTPPDQSQAQRRPSSQSQQDNKNRVQLARHTASKPVEVTMRGGPVDVTMRGEEVGVENTRAERRVLMRTQRLMRNSDSQLTNFWRNGKPAVKRASKVQFDSLREESGTEQGDEGSDEGSDEGKHWGDEIDY